MTQFTQEQREEIDAMITERILALLQRLDMDGQLLPPMDNQRFGVSTGSKVRDRREGGDDPKQFLEARS